MGFAREDDAAAGRLNQRLRTRRAIVDAAIRLAREGRPLNIAEVAASALVSTATAYRYFPNPQSLWIEVASAGGGELSVESILEGAPDDPAARMDHIVSRITELQFRDEAMWRAIVRAILERWFEQADVPEPERVPVHGDRRLTLTREALAGLKDTLPPELHERLVMAVALVFGAEAMIAARDACGLEPAEAGETMRWAVQAMIKQARAEAAEGRDHRS